MSVRKRQGRVCHYPFLDSLFFPDCLVLCKTPRFLPRSENPSFCPLIIMMIARHMGAIWVIVSGAVAVAVSCSSSLLIPKGCCLMVALQQVESSSPKVGGPVMGKPPRQGHHSGPVQKRASSERRMSLDVCDMVPSLCWWSLTSLLRSVGSNGGAVGSIFHHTLSSQDPSAGGLLKALLSHSSRVVALSSASELGTRFSPVLPSTFAIQFSLPLRVPLSALRAVQVPIEDRLVEYRNYSHHHHRRCHHHHLLVCCP